MSEPSSFHEWPDMIEDCQLLEEQLSVWEIEFIDSIENQLGSGAMLTDAQRDKLDEIWERITT